MVLLAAVADATTRRSNVLQVAAGDPAFSGRRCYLLGDEKLQPVVGDYARRRGIWSDL
jgi:hypothetical protein